MAHVVMASIPAPGHVNPHAEVVRRLVERGHRVSYVQDASWQTQVESLGATCVPYPSVLARHTFDEETDAVDHLALFQAEYEAMLPVVESVLDHDPADLVLHDIAGVPARLLAVERGLPELQLSATYVAWDGYDDDMTEFLDGVRSDPRGQAYLARQSTMLAAHGVHADPLAWLGRPDRSLVLVAEALQPHADQVDRDVYTFVGPAVRRPDASLWSPRDDRRLVLVSLGSAFTRQPDFYRACLAAFGDLPDTRLVLQVGQHVSEQEVSGGRALPEHVEIHPWVAQREMLEHADVFVTHAGMAGSSEGLVTGTPMIAVPQAVDQFDNADALAELGVAVRLDTAQATAESLRRAHAQVTTDAVRDRSREVAAQLADAGGADRAVEIVEEILR
ncbi:MAG: glycosyl transferase [Actinomycetales bacterium]|nr:MAG: glycosyl transferase [Actinomycetales bacterium]